jgi:hypothetical protein
MMGDHVHAMVLSMLRGWLKVGAKVELVHEMCKKEIINYTKFIGATNKFM